MDDFRNKTICSDGFELVFSSFTSRKDLIIFCITDASNVYSRSHFCQRFKSVGDLMRPAGGHV